MPTLPELLDHFPERVLFVGLAGSQAYGTATPESDVDLRGLFALPARDYLSLSAPPPGKTTAMF